MSLIAIAIAASGATPVVAEVPHAERRLLLSSRELFGMVEEAHRRGDEPTALAALRALMQDRDQHVRNEARLRLALLVHGKGQARAAAVLLRRILDERPDASAVRLQLAAILHRLGQEEAALRELRALRSIDLPPGVARVVDGMSASLQASKPFGLQLEFALAPDSNINRATTSTTLGTIFGDFALDEGSSARSGVGAAVRGIAHARQSLNSGINLVARATAEANLYKDSGYNDISLEVSAGPEFAVGRTRLTGEAAVGQQWYGMKPFQRGLRLSGSATRPLDPVSQLRIDASTRWNDNRLNDLQDGHGLSLRARYERALSPRMLVAASIGADCYQARDNAYSTKTWNAGLAGFYEVGRATLSIGAEIGRLKADDRLVLLPEARRDRMTRLQLGAVFRQFTVLGFAPMTRLVVERNRSTVEFHDYRRTRTEFGVTRAF